ncbi:MAG TPA: N-acetylneuraminate synthase [Candidatus Hydrogenedentes bacterium]|nr:N-acetylneuraminate synthase [Candidatus Hydrogenedentota bacterium]HIJ72715.1 N-acetylneuraminate synthase [Candidatus Hydrogenedentota bacterium]
MSCRCFEVAFRGVSKLLGDGAPVFLAAEIGLNHNGDLALAKECISAAAAAGADAVKFQNYRTEDFLQDESLMYTYVCDGETVSEPQYAMFKRCELSLDDLSVLADYAAEEKVLFFSTPSGTTGVDDIMRLGLPLIKNASDSLGNRTLLRKMAATGLPCVLSTGMATLDEINTAVDVFRQTGNDQLVLAVCTSLYPTPSEQVNLRRIATLCEAFQCPVGFSDHTEGIAAPAGAVALGAVYVEKHFTLDKTLPGPDHRFSADPMEFQQLAEAVRTVEAALGSGTIGPTPSETQARAQFGFSLCAARDLETGHVLAEQDIALYRPGTGLPPQAEERIVGRALRNAVKKGQQFTLAMFG